MYALFLWKRPTLCPSSFFFFILFEIFLPSYFLKIIFQYSFFFSLWKRHDLLLLIIMLSFILKWIYVFIKSVKKSYSLPSFLLACYFFFFHNYCLISFLLADYLSQCHYLALFFFLIFYPLVTIASWSLFYSFIHSLNFSFISFF